MKRKIFIATLCLITATSFAQTNKNYSCEVDKTVMEEDYSQQISSSLNAYPEWHPSESACPLHPTRAVSLAKQAASRAFPNFVDWKFCAISLQTDPRDDDYDVWFYEIELHPLFAREKAERITCVFVVVGLDGSVREIKTVGSHSTGSYAKRLHRVQERINKEKGVTKEEYIDLMHQVEPPPPRPIPLTPEMEKKFVKEGVLPPLQKE